MIVVVVLVTINTSCLIITMIIICMIMIMIMMMMMNLEECMVCDKGQVADLPLPLLPSWTSLAPRINSLLKSDQSQLE